MDLTTRFAMEPYITPIPQEKQNNSTNKMYPNTGTLDTLFTTLHEKRSDLIKNDSDLLSKLDNIDQNLPKIYGLQSDKLSLPIPNDVDRSTIPLFMANLQDSTRHRYTFCPVPNIEDMKLFDFLKFCVENRIASDNASWAVHCYIKKNNLNIDLTSEFKKLLIRDPTKASILQKPNYSHFANFAYSLYVSNLLKHEDIIISLMDQLPPECMKIFETEILSTYFLVFRYLTVSENKVKYKLLFAEELGKIRSQLVQLGLHDFPISEREKETVSDFIQDLQTEETESRIKSLKNTLDQVRLSYATHYRNLIFCSFPFIDPSIILDKMTVIMKYSTKSDRQKFGISLCESVIWFSTRHEAVSATAAYLIKNLVPCFKVAKFFKLLIKHHSRIELFRYLFLELQLQGIFEYKTFLKYLKTNDVLSHREEAADLMASLPSMDGSARTLNDIARILNDLFPENDFNHRIMEISHDLIGNADKMVGIPYVFRFQLILYLIHQQKWDFGTICPILQKNDALSLITVLFSTCRPAKFTVFDFPFIEKTIPCFIAHNLLDALAKTALPPENPNYKISELLARYLKESEERGVPTPLSSYKGQIQTKKQSSKNIFVAVDNLQELITNYSHLCSLHIFDLFFSVRQDSDFRKVFNQFLKDLLNFPLLTKEMLFDFFVNFCESQCISKSSDQFIFCFMQTIITNQNLVEDENSNSRQVITDFLTLLFKNNFINPSSYLKFILSKSRTNGNINEHLVNLFFKIIEENPNSFPIESILSENVISNLSDGEIYRTLLTKLREFPSPIINSSLQTVLVKDVPSAISAAYYSLLPVELQEPNFSDVFRYFAENVDRTTSTFWTLWLRYKVFYNSGFPVTPLHEKSQLNEHYTELWQCFYNLILMNEYDKSNHEMSEKFQIYINCWTLLFTDPQDQFSQFVFSKTAQNIKYESPLININQIDYLHPIINNCNEAILEQICDGFCQCKFSNNELNEENVTLMKIACCAFVAFANRFIREKMQSTKIVKIMADMLLDWLKLMLNSHARQTETFVLDAFNFIVTRTVDVGPEQNRDFHEHIKPKLDAIPSSYRKYILVNYIMKSFEKDQDPMYFNSIVPPQDTGSSAFTFENDAISSLSYDVGQFELGNEFMWF